MEHIGADGGGMDPALRAEGRMSPRRGRVLGEGLAP